MNNLTVFYADDDSEDLEFFREIAGSIEGVTLFTHNRGDAMLKALENPPPSPQVIFLDLNMPGKNGYEVLSDLKQNEQLKGIPVVIFSTSSDEKSISKTRELGANFYLPKLMDYNSFKKSIEYALSINWKTFVTSPENFCYSAA